ncbi:MAG: hypothetical protein HJJLKODD_00070 [Phycisphaerae bacterium]|nr:hypothetical protein [Phycisphaerae bacterium]
MSRRVGRLNRVLWLVPALLLVAYTPALGQEDQSGDDPDMFEKAPPQPGGPGGGPRARMRDPEKIKARIAELEAEREKIASEDPNSPELERIDRQLERLNQILENIEAGRGPMGGPGGPDGPGGPGGEWGFMGQFDEEKISEFLDAHPDLKEILQTRPDGTKANADEARGNIRRHGMQLAKIMKAYEGGNEAYGTVLIDGAKNQFAIAQKMHTYRNSDEATQEKMKADLADLVSKQVGLELQAREFEIAQLEERLAKEKQKLAEDQSRQEEIAEKKLKGILSGKGIGETFRGSEGGRGPGRGPGRNRAPEAESPPPPPPADE